VDLVSHRPAIGSHATVTGGLATGGLSYAAADRVKLVHANDSKLGCGSRRDRHETIGSGFLGLAPFGELLAALPSAPFVVETPGGKAGHARDVATLKRLREAMATPWARAALDKGSC
jgi:hypothetical protein